MNAIDQTYQLIKKYDIHARKRFGQNFLIDERVLDKIVDRGKRSHKGHAGPGDRSGTRNADKGYVREGEACSCRGD